MLRSLFESTWKAYDLLILSGLKLIYDHCFGIHADERVDDEVRDCTFDARDVKGQGEQALRRIHGDGIASK